MLLQLLLLLQDPGQDNMYIVCITVLLELMTAPLALANQQLSLLGRTCSTRPTQDSIAASLSIVWTVIRSSDEVLWQTGCIHPDCPCTPIAVLQPPLQGPIILLFSLASDQLQHYKVIFCFWMSDSNSMPLICQSCELITSYNIIHAELQVSKISLICPDFKLKMVVICTIYIGIIRYAY